MKQSLERTQIARDIWKANSHNTRFFLSGLCSDSQLSVSPSAKYFPMGGSLWLPAQHHTQRLMKNPKALRMAGSFIYLPFIWAVQLADRLHSTLNRESSRQRSIRVSNEN